ncbi:MAG: hypothetical protein JST54_34470, partial [Deltaproteobacteria bacterium]|nr:hypothetical protein [Deltaproteobacteria bacterium]
STTGTNANGSSTGTNANGSSTGTTTGSSTGSSTGGTTGSCSGTCVEQANAACAQMKACAPYVYAITYENDDTLCASEATRLCNLSSSAYGIDNLSPGVADACACEAALNGSCASYLAALDPKEPLAACQGNPGHLTQGQGCFATAQCSAGLSCQAGGSSCPTSCVRVGTAGTVCTADNDCDVANGLRCTTGIEGLGMDINNLCRPVTYGAAGATCYPGSDEQCGSGLVCQKTTTFADGGAGNPWGVCTAALLEGATCDTTKFYDPNPCESRLGLQCTPVDLANPTQGTPVCQKRYFVPDGAQCGNVVDGTVTHLHECGSYSYCDGTNICRRKSQEGQACANANACFPPYTCQLGTCQSPAMQIDPICTRKDVSANTCGSACNSGQACCDGSAPACGTVGACSGSAFDELDCEDSSQCGNGSLCCMTVTPGNKPRATCVSQASCQMEICRTDANPFTCGGSGHCEYYNVGQDDFAGYLPTNVGFCRDPGCTVGACNADGQCCSGSCDVNNFVCR